ncbi:MAG: LUD domain-containing protein [Dysosmobacter welbionis]
MAWRSRGDRQHRRHRQPGVRYAVRPEKVYFVIGRNKLAPTYEAAVYRARNVAAPQRARQLGKKTPCAVKADRCYDCRSPERVCRALVTLWGPMLGMETEVLLVDEDLGL